MNLESVYPSVKWGMAITYLDRWWGGPNYMTRGKCYTLQVLGRWGSPGAPHTLPPILLAPKLPRKALISSSHFLLFCFTSDVHSQEPGHFGMENEGTMKVDGPAKPIVYVKPMRCETRGFMAHLGERGQGRHGGRRNQSFSRKLWGQENGREGMRCSRRSPSAKDL